MSTLIELSDGDLVALLLRQDEDAFAELFRRHSRSVAAAARMILGPWSGCDDVVAEVFLALWLAPQSFDPARGSLLGFLRVKAKGRSIDVVRSETARVRRERANAPQREAELTLDAELMASEAAAVLNQAIASLPPDEREPIQLAFHQGLTYRAIAGQLGIPEGTIKSRIRSALRHLRQYIQLHQLSEDELFADTLHDQETVREAARA